MEFTKEFIDGLAVNEAALIKKIAGRLETDSGQVSAAAALLAEGCTVPFIARYRKEKTGNLDEVQIRGIEHGLNAEKNLENRRLEIIRGIFDQGKLTETLYENILRAASSAELEDIYSPYKRKKKTRAMIAVEMGLAPLAEAMKKLEAEPLRAFAAEFVRAALETAPETPGGPASADDALQGAMDIIAEEVSQDAGNRSSVKAFYLKDGQVIIKGKGSEDEKNASTYKMYWDYKEPLSGVKPHRILAANRGEREGVLEITIDVNENAAAQMLQGRYELHNDYHRTAVEDGLKRLLSPAVIREIRGDQGDAADDHGISVFSRNIKNLLMQQPIKGRRVLGMDPGIRTGTKCASLDDTGKYLGNIVIYNNRVEESKRLILEGIRKYDVQLIAVGNGTGSRDVQEIITSLIAEHNLEILFTVVDEDGASVYSASDIAREEFPDLDLTIRGAISIGRRLQDPLAELVKIDPKSIGVGLYQHDVNQKKLSETLDEVVFSVVNNVGVNLNTASASLLRYVSGISGSLAKKIVKYRDENGRIAGREELVSIPGMGPKSYEQCAGFLKIPESADPLDNTWVHPENYPAAREIQKKMEEGTVTATGNLSPELAAQWKEKFSVGDATIRDIIEELGKPGRDPRDAYPKPIMQKGLASFEDLAEGMIVTGKIKNVVDFGAFVDLGIKETALVHVSQMSDHFVKDPLEAVKAGDVLEFRIISLDRERRRISLSRKKERPAEKHGAENNGAAEHGGAKHGPAERGRNTGRSPSAHGPAASGADRKREQVRPQRESFRDDDGTMYNPFAEAFKKRGNHS
ncbi:MAG: RNA-binding transcriptional accessory protein [Treponema sp.]|jgi:uncharacterized protein|nr:RNA-binding transcriptional accessory protein [Treponema sp.]